MVSRGVQGQVLSSFERVGSFETLSLLAVCMQWLALSCAQATACRLVDCSLLLTGWLRLVDCMAQTSHWWIGCVVFGLAGHLLHVQAAAASWHCCSRWRHSTCAWRREFLVPLLMGVCGCEPL